MRVPAAFRHALASIAEWAKPSLIPAAIAGCVILTAGIVYERQNEHIYRNELQNHVAGDLALVAARLQSQVNGNVAALRSVANMFAVAPEQATLQFNVFARKLMLQNTHFRRVGVAPEGTVRQAFPLDGNQHYLGTNFNRFPSFRRAAQMDRSRGRPLMFGPVQFAKGGRGFNLFIPVFTNVEARHYFWGYIDGLIDERKLFTDAGLFDADQPTRHSAQRHETDIQLAIRDVSVPDNIVDPFFGDAEVFEKEPVLQALDFPGGRWQLAAIPSKGWQHPPENLTQIRLIIAAAALVIIVPIFLTGGLVSERQRNIARLRARERQVQSLSQRLDIALDASKIGIWEVELSTGARNWDEQMHRLHGFPENETPNDHEWRSVLHPDDVAIARGEMDRIRAGGNDYKSQYRILMPDGNWHHIRNVGSRLTGPNGEDKLTGISWDVTEDVLLNEALKSAKDHAEVQNAELAKLTQRLDLALDSYECGLWEADLEDGLTLWDDRMHQLYGITNTGKRITHDIWINAIHPDDRAEAEGKASRTIDENVPYSRTSRVVHPDGSIRHIQSVGKLHTGQDGRRKLVGLAFDVTDDMQMTARLRQAKEQSERQNTELEQTSRRLDLALDSYQCGLWEADLDLGRTYWDERMHQLYGLVFTDGTVTHEEWLAAMHPDDREETVQTVNHCVEHDLPYVREARILMPDGEIRHVRSVGKVHHAQDGGRKLIGLAFDVTEDVILKENLKAAKEQADAKNIELEQAKVRIEHNALHDPLTGLGNRRKLDDELTDIATRSETKDARVGILHIDLDRFKQINDTLGHAAGDALLVHASQVLRACVHTGDLVARIGGDEFVVVVTNTTDQVYLSALSRRIISLMQQPVEYEGHLCRFGVSIGIALAEGRSIDTARLLVNADIALYRAKALGRNRHEFFTEALQAEIISNKRIADDILAGIENNEFVPYYQPQIDAGTLKLAGAEALIRWNHPREGLLTPDHFLKIAEDLNVMATLDRIVLEKALLDCARWAAQGLIMPKISVNVSARRLRDESLIDSLTGLSIQPGQIAFELVESIFLDESDDVVLTNLERIKALGIDIEIDDFGTGHTSIVSLLKLKPKRLKIDRQLVAPILTARNEQALVRSIIEIGRSLGIEIVAEGVETMEHAEMLGLLGCDLLQGYAFAKPLSRDAFLAFGSEMRWKLAS
ncbi:EAL domain-containing protein [Shinella sp. 838]|uniref:bifunctional diguanylate cyclase/phosphodiesterase n=1 Tax=unclassified Shinella TaxID=2643062 RepID=UPI0003C55B71|nr:MULTISPECIES: EAL domain-containing protein [unclassified Shinella]EYR79542.1 diguanylate cyclase/phosphodiesterase with PAS/PAC sensor [Shinella sp. DD12]MCA0341268.1 EAL domain-containing protein [Pseudomonadota bacterium]MDG4671152.1 EAL domain-containing protein [Shinella sp. 838]